MCAFSFEDEKLTFKRLRMSDYQSPFLLSPWPQNQSYSLNLNQRGKKTTKRKTQQTTTISVAEKFHKLRVNYDFDYSALLILLVFSLLSFINH